MYTICYSRISTKNPEQFVSLNNQNKTITKFVKTNKIKNTINLSESVSISDYMSKNLAEICVQYVKVNIIVTSFDRLSRNLVDYKFLRKHVDKIYIISEKKTYTPSENVDDFVKSYIMSMNEIDKIKFRIKQNHNKRVRSDEDLVLNAQLRKNSIYGILSEKYPIELLNNLIKFIKMSIQLKSVDELNDFDKVYKQFTNKNLKQSYTHCNFKLYSFHIPRKDLYEYIKNMLQQSQHDLYNDEPNLKEFVDSQINYFKKVNKFNIDLVDKVEKMKLV